MEVLAHLQPSVRSLTVIHPAPLERGEEVVVHVTAQVERRPATSAHGSTLGSNSVQSTPSSADRLIGLRFHLDRQFGCDQHRQEVRSP